MPELKLPVLAVLGLAGVAADWLSLAVFSLIVALSTVFWRLKLELVVLWLLLVVRGTAVGGPGGWGGQEGCLVILAKYTQLTDQSMASLSLLLLGRVWRP